MGQMKEDETYTIEKKTADCNEKNAVTCDDAVKNEKSADTKLLGCDHYKRNASLVAPCCGEVYPCRLCHDEAQEHQLVRSEVVQVVCRSCNTRQPPTQTCSHCDAPLAKYFCAECRLYDDEPRGQFHCARCGLCRVGGRQNYFHCDNCDLCLPLALRNNHKCIERVGRADCSVCLEDLHTARHSARKLPCGHLLHQPCYAELVMHGKSTCPQCNTTLFDMSETWAYMDREVKRCKLPSELRHCFVQALCRDCHQSGETAYNLVGLKCTHCGSFNTTRTEGPLVRRSSGSGRGGLHLMSCFPNFKGLLSRNRLTQSVV